MNMDMEIIKSKLSLQLLTNVAPILKANSPKITISTNKDILFLLEDKNPNYDFYFRVEKEEFKDGSPIIVSFNCKPFSETQKDPISKRNVLTAFIKKLAEWLENIEKYKRETIYVDPLEKQFQEEFYNDFKIIDKEVKAKAFSFSQQILLLNYIESAEIYLTGESSGLTEEDKAELIEETKALKQQIGAETKDGYMKKQTLFWAKIRKKSVKAAEFVVKEFFSAFIKIVAEKGMNIEWHSLPHYVFNQKLTL